MLRSTSFQNFRKKGGENIEYMSVERPEIENKNSEKQKIINKITDGIIKTEKELENLGWFFLLTRMATFLLETKMVLLDAQTFLKKQNMMALI